jgi:UDP-N-acetylglucosamine 2-epimerase (non-hydrolysing)
MKIILVVGARPNFMKIAPIIDAIKGYNRSSDRPLNYLLVHTGQHYDEKMSKLFFDDLAIPKPDIDLGVGSASHAEQTAEIIKRFEKVCTRENPTHVLVVGDVNSTIACALVASKLNIKIIHVEAGLRSFDRSMPEEINRVLTDAISDCLFITEKSAEENLLKEGIAKEKIFFVGNVMIDTLFKHLQKAQESSILDRLGLKSNMSICSQYCLLTLHRPSNVDNEQIFKDILEALVEIAGQIPIIFPVHPRTMSRIKEFNMEEHFIQNSALKRRTSGICCIEPLGYLDFLSLMSHARLVLTDSGGIQEETTVLGVPCLTLRENTERPVTVTDGTNIVAGTKKQVITGAALSFLNGCNKSFGSGKKVPPLWDGKAATRIVSILVRSYQRSNVSACKSSNKKL